MVWKNPPPWKVQEHNRLRYCTVRVLGNLLYSIERPFTASRRDIQSEISHKYVYLCWVASTSSRSKINNGFLQLIPVPDGNNLRSFKMVFQMVLPSDELERVQEPESVYLQTFSVLKSWWHVSFRSVAVATPLEEWTWRNSESTAISIH